ncbi:MAG: cytochrome P450 [Okeania sp. SIO3I5]|uniref:cytochrome P450 n=1 Tax=Okeania sp. SIO3I5 TaxID=2607805 RepID=UPI0013BC2732|nr:cytochrome P450 [Okeania sp. SIO3I5]NEQ41892.1 cytochrome P450 [Okeania sp. SIO3I5]
MTLPNGPALSPLQQRIRTWKFILSPLSAIEERYSEYGDVFRTNTNSLFPFIYFCNPKAIQQIFTADPDIFGLGGSNGVLGHFVGENSLLLLDGDRHRQQRKLLMPPFHGDRMRSYGDLIYKITSDVISQWEIDKPFPIRKSTQEISLKVILGAVFGLNQGERYEKLRLLMSDVLDSMSSPLSSIFLFFRFLQKDWGSWSPWGRFLRKKQELHELTLAEIATAKKEGNHRDDILSLLLEARDETGNPMSDEEIKDELLTMLMAGHETTASALAWALYWIDKIPSVREKLRAELATLPNNSDKVAITKLPYLNAVCQETLRIYPIVTNAFPRVVQKPIEIMGYQLEPGMVAIVSIYLTHHREDIYPEPKQFKPERFLERQFSPYEYLPFGGGSRRCIGSAFALFEMKLVLATILSQYELKLVSNRLIKPVRRGVTMAPPGNMRMVVKQKFRE